MLIKLKSRDGVKQKNKEYYSHVHIIVLNAELTSGFEEVWLDFLIDNLYLARSIGYLVIVLS